MKFVQALQDFRAVVDSCFRNDFGGDYKTKVAAFRQSYSDFDKSVTPKVYEIFFHIEDLCNQKQVGLGFFSVQAMESIRFDFSAVWKKYKAAHDHHEYATMLHHAIYEYNRLHIYIYSL